MMKTISGVALHLQFHPHGLYQLYHHGRIQDILPHRNHVRIVKTTINSPPELLAEELPAARKVETTRILQMKAEETEKEVEETKAGDPTVPVKMII